MPTPVLVCLSCPTAILDGCQGTKEIVSYALNFPQTLNFWLKEQSFGHMGNMILNGIKKKYRGGLREGLSEPVSLENAGHKGASPAISEQRESLTAEEQQQMV